MNKRDKERLKAAYEMEGDATIGAGAGFDKYTKEVAMRIRWRGTKFDPRCGSQGVDGDGHCMRCGLRVHEDADENCPPGFLPAPPTEAKTEAAPVERIVAAAINFDDITMSMPPPARHHTILWKLVELNLPEGFMDIRNQGFVTSTGRFVDRYEACKIARAARQLVREPTPKDVLTSEDVW
jgi:hypothetical protein